MRVAEARIIEFARYAVVCDRVQLAEALDLPEPTVTSAVRRLVADGRLEAADGSARRTGSGRPRSLVRLVGPDRLLGLVTWAEDRLALRVARFDGEVVDRRSVPVPAGDVGVEGLAAAIEALRTAASAVEGAALAVVVVAAPAPFLHGSGSPDGPASARARRFALQATEDPEAALAARFGLPVLIENDANLAAIGEQYAGRARSRHFLSITLNGNGFGSALVVDGAILRGARGYAGELAHLQVDPDGPICECGGRGCLWTTVRAQAVAATRTAYPAPIPFAELPARAAAGDAGAARVLRDVGRALGRPIGHIATAFDPELVVVDRALGPQVEEVVAGIRESFSVSAPPAIADRVPIVVSELGDRAQLIGAIELTRESARRG